MNTSRPSFRRAAAPAALSPRAFLHSAILLAVCLSTLQPVRAQLLLNVDFGTGSVSAKTGLAGAGLTTNDFWNLYAPYRPRFTAGMTPVPDGRLSGIVLSDHTPTAIEVAVTNAPGVWGNATGDPMVDTYLFASNGSNIVVTITGLEIGSYHLYLYGHAAADAMAEQNSVFTVHTGTNSLGPLTATFPAGWQPGQPWRERSQYVLFRDVPVLDNEPVRIEVSAGPQGVPVLNGLQVLSRGTGPPRLITSAQPADSGAYSNLLIRAVHYTGKLSDTEARFSVTLEVESLNPNVISAPLFEGDLALLDPKLPEGWRLVNRGRQFVLIATRPNAAQLTFTLLARIDRKEPWNQIDFTGPAAAIATVEAESTQSGIQLELVSGTPASPPGRGAPAVRGALGADRRLAIRWQSQTAEITRPALVTVDTASTLMINPAAIRQTSRLQGEVLQGSLRQFRVALPTGHTLTKLEAAQVRDWQVNPEAGQSVLVLEFLKPVEQTFALTLTTEQPLGSLPADLAFAPPQAIDPQRESGTITVIAEDVDVRIQTIHGLRQVNAPSGTLASYQFHGRPATLHAQLRRILPEIQVASRIAVSVGETLLSVRHALTLDVSRAGVYSLEAALPEAFRVAHVQGDGIEDWTTADRRVQVRFSQRVLGQHRLELLLEQAYPTVPPELVIEPLPVTDATRETVRVGARSAPGIQLKTAELVGLRELPITALSDHTDELLAYHADQSPWRLALAAEQLEARVVAEVFNLITLGDGLVGGSATLRYGILHQGVQQFRVQVPPHWRNIDFTGPNIRRKDQQADVWTIALQDKVWGGYTLVATYDYPFDPHQASLDLAGAQPQDVLRDSGTVAVTSAAGLQVDPQPITAPLRRIDVTEIPDADRSLIARPVLFAYRYDGGPYQLTMDLVRHEEVQPLDAVADRTQLTTVLTDAGEMLTQAGFMVKNNDRQFQRFKLPPGATLWGVYVNGTPARAERDDDWLLVSLPRTANRDQAFAVDLKYAQKLAPLPRWFPQHLDLVAPRTDVPSTYAEWELFVPASRRLASFGGNMTAARGTTHSFRDAWAAFTGFYRGLWIEYGARLVVGGGLILLFASLVVSAMRRGAQAVVQVLVVFTVLAILAGMLLPALSKAKSKAQRISSVNNLKQIGLAARIFAADNQDRLPASFDEMMNELGTPKVLIDPETGERYTYVGAGKSEADPFGILAYSSSKRGHREVAFVDGSVQMMTEERFQEALTKEAVSKGQLIASPSALLEERYGLRAADTPQPPPAPAASTSPPGSPPVSPTVTATATGIRSIRIDLPRTGRPFHFTKILNVDEEPLHITASMMRNRTYQLTHMLIQVAAFLCGLMLAWVQWRREPPGTLGLTIAAALMIGSTASLLVAWRVLHLVLIAAVPLAILIGLLTVALRFLRRNRAEPDTSLPPPLANTAVSLTLATLLAHTTLQATPAPATNADAPSSLPEVTILSASYEGQVSVNVATLNLTLILTSAATNQTLLLFQDDVSIQDFSVQQGEARIWRETGTVGLLLPRPGLLQARVRLLVRVQDAGDRRQLSFHTPAALATRLSLLIEEAEADVECPAAVALRTSAENQGTRVESVVGGTPRVDLSWTPRMKRAADIAATVFSQVAAHVTAGNGTLNTRTRFQYQVTQGELRQVRLRLPAGQQVLRVEGEFIRLWDFATAARDELVVTLARGVAPVWHLAIETEQPLGSLPAALSLRLPRTLDVNRESGGLLLSAAEDLALTVDQATGLQRVDATDLSQSFDHPTGVISAHRFVAPDFELRATADHIHPVVDAVVHHRFTFAPNQLSLDARIGIVIKRSGIFTLRIALPDGPRLESVTCDPMHRWTETQWEGRRCLELTLQARTLGEVQITLRLVQPLPGLPPVFDLAGVRPLQVNKLSDFILVTAEPGVALKTAQFENLTEIAPSALEQPMPGGPGTSGLAFRSLAADPDIGQAWTLSVATEPIEPWIRAEIVNITTVTETLITGRAQVRFEVQNAPTGEFHLRIPEHCLNVDIQGANLRRRDQINGIWRVELQGKVHGIQDLTVTWEQPRSPGTNDWLFTGVEAPGVERDVGCVVFVSRSPVQVLPRTVTGDLSRIDVRELPAWATLGTTIATDSNAAVLAYRYLRPGYTVVSGIQQFEEAALLQALVESVHLVTVVSDDGQRITEMTLSVRNKGRQYLELRLPQATTLWSASVGGQPVRPTRRNGSHLLPIERIGGTDEPLSVRLTYVGRSRFPYTRGRVDFESPAFDLPLKDARWDIFLPPDYEFRRFQGSMQLQTTELAPLAQEFTLAEYARQEATQAEASRAEAAGNIRRARSLLSAGKVQQAVEDVSLYRNLATDGSVSQVELRQLEEELSRGQASNLIQAQRDYTFSNLARYQSAGGPSPTAPHTMPAGDEEEAARRQVQALQKMQAIGVAPLQPLRVNLPTRGLRHSFTQVLQTETDKPLTVRLTAQHTRKSGSFRRLLFWITGFTALWIGVRIGVGFRSPRPESHRRS
jgi:hypothetical protein